MIEKIRSLIVAIYARVSTGRQEQEETIDSQIDEIRRKIADDGNILPDENIFVDDGWTGEILQRPGLDAMRDAAMAGKFDILYVYDRGRLSRVFAHQEVLIEELIDRDIQFVTLHDVKAETPEERVLQAMQGVFHQYERVKIVERMRRGKLFKARSGIIINGSSLYGYNYVKKTDASPTHWELNEEESRTVGLICEWFGIERISVRQIIRRLYDLGIPPRKGKSKFWTKGPIVRILKCETYFTGVAYYNKSEAIVSKNPTNNNKYKKVKKSSRKMRPKEEWIPFNVPKMMDDLELFDRIQKILDFNQKYAKKNRKFDYLLTSKVYCECGNRRVGDGSSKNGHYYYRCIDRIRKFPLDRTCDSQGVNAAILDIMMWKELEKRLADPEFLRKYAEEWLKSDADNESVNKEKLRLTGSIQKIEEEERRYAKAYGTETLEFEHFSELLKEAGKRKLLLQNQLNQLNVKSQEQTIKIKAEDIVQETENVLKTLDFANKKLVVTDIIDKVIIKQEQGVEVLGHIPLTAHKLGYESESRDCGVA